MNDHTRVGELEHIRIVGHTNSLAVEFFRCMYGEHAVVPKEPLYELQAYPCWALACHAYQELLGIDPRESLARLNGKPPTWTDSTPRGDFSILQDEHVTLPPGYTNGQWAWTPPPKQSWEAEVIENARRIERDLS
jgi:hypothetical protein